MSILTNNKTFWLLRGVSGSGKTTIARTLEDNLVNAVAFSADDYWYDTEGTYNFNVHDLYKAHNWCKSLVQGAMSTGVTNIILHNTNTSDKEIKYYLDLAEEHGYIVNSLVVENRHGSESVHNVPEVVLDRQESRLKNSIKLRG